MDRHAVYTILAAELEHWRGLPYETLIGYVGAGPTARTVELSGDMMSVEIVVRWQNAATGAIRIEATGNGPSWWKMERLEEAATVPNPCPDSPH